MASTAPTLSSASMTNAVATSDTTTREEDIPEKQHKCLVPECRFAFDKIENLAIHQRVHVAELEAMETKEQKQAHKEAHKDAHKDAHKQESGEKTTASESAPESSGESSGGKRKGPLQVIWLNAGKDKPALFSLQFNEESKFPVDHFLNSVKSQVFGVRPDVFLEYASISPALTMLYLEERWTGRAYNRALQSLGWPIEGHAVIYKSEALDPEWTGAKAGEGGEGDEADGEGVNGDVDVFYDLTQKDIDDLPTTFAADKKRRQEHRAELEASGAKVISMGANFDLASLLGGINPTRPTNPKPKSESESEQSES